MNIQKQRTSKGQIRREEETRERKAKKSRRTHNGETLTLATPSVQSILSNGRCSVSYRWACMFCMPLFKFTQFATACRYLLFFSFFLFLYPSHYVLGFQSSIWQCLTPLRPSRRDWMIPLNRLLRFTSLAHFFCIFVFALFSLTSRCSPYFSFRFSFSFAHYSTCTKYW